MSHIIDAGSIPFERGPFPPDDAALIARLRAYGLPACLEAADRLEALTSGQQTAAARNAALDDALAALPKDTDSASCDYGGMGEWGSGFNYALEEAREAIAALKTPEPKRPDDVGSCGHSRLYSTSRAIACDVCGREWPGIDGGRD